MFNNFFIQPLDMHYHEYQSFFRFAIEGNRIYREICAWVDPTTEGMVKVVVMLCCHNGENVVYVNNQQDYQKMKSHIETTAISKVIYSPIRLLTREGKLFNFTNLFFRTQKSEKIEVVLYTLNKVYNQRRAIQREKNSMDPENCTLVYSAKTLKSNQRSKIVIMGRPYEIRKNNNPIYFMRSPMVSYVRDMGMVQLKKQEKTLIPVSLPDSVYVGAKYVYHCEEQEVVYTVEKISPEGISITQGKNRIVAQDTPEGLAIEKVFITRHPQAPQLFFSPPIPLNISESDLISEHVMELKMGKTIEQCDLTMTYYKDRGFVGELVNPHWGWSREFPMVFSVLYEENQVKVLNGQMENDLLPIEIESPKGL